MRPAFIPSLDGIRAVAVLLVLFFHWPYSTLRLPFGWIGVQIFFVLSGFLITRSLLYEKEQKRSLSSYLYQFYAKRALRIFPLYYLFCALLGLALFVALLANWSTLLHSLREVPYNWPYLLTYTYNFQRVLNYWLELPWENSLLLSHLWSLSVEEQFYLVFPFLVFFLSRARLRLVLIALFIGCPLLRFLGIELLWQIFPDINWVGGIIYRLTPFQADSLALGGLLALHEGKPLPRVRLLFHLVLLITLVLGISQALLLGVSVQGLGFSSPEALVTNHRAVYGFTLINLCSLLLIACSVAGAPLFRQLEERRVCYFGKISYGIYLFHPPIYLFMEYLIPAQWLAQHKVLELLLFPIAVFVVFGVCHLLYQYFEKRFLVLKTRVDPESFIR